MSGLLVVTVTFVAVIVGVYLFLYVAQDRILFPATRIMDRTPADFGWEFEEVRRNVGIDETYGWYIPTEGHRGVVLFSHGNAGNLAGRLESISLLRGFGFSVLAYDYGGYGYSTGRPSEQRCYGDIRAMWDYLTETKGFAAREILLFGRSLGAAPTIELARHVEPGAVIIESAFLSTPDVARRHPLFRPLAWAIHHRFDNKSNVGEIQSPLLIVHSPDDEIIPFDHGKELYALAAEPKEFLEIQGGHNTGFVDSPNYRPGWERFLAPIFGSKTASDELPR